MPVTTVDTVPALVVIDLQEGLRGAATAHPFDDVVARTAELARAFRERDLPVVLVTADGRAPGRTEGGAGGGSLPDGFADVLRELDPADADVRVVKQSWGAFHGTDLDTQLRGRGVTQVMITGVATSAGVESTARSAHDLGYHVVLVADAMTDRDPDSHAHSLGRVFPKLGETGSTADVLALLSER